MTLRTVVGHTNANATREARTLPDFYTESCTESSMVPDSCRCKEGALAEASKASKTATPTSTQLKTLACLIAIDDSSSIATNLNANKICCKLLSSSKM